MAVKVREKPKGSGVWWLFIDHQGRRRAKKVGRDKRLALEAAKKIEAKLTLGDMGVIDPKAKTVPTFGEYAELWLNTYIKKLRRESTYKRYRILLDKYILPVFAKKRLNEITRGEIRDFLLSLYGDKLSASTVRLTRDVISGPLNYALDEELIQANPVSGVTKRLGLKRGPKEPIIPLTDEEVELFLETCQEHYPDHYPFFLTAFRTGVRLGELLGLQWGDIDWRGRFIVVRRSYKLGKISPTKTGKVRRVDMSDQLVETLRGLLARRKREALEQGRGEIVETVFHLKGQPMAQNSIRHYFKRVLRKAGLRDIRFHDVRHAYASLLLGKGISPVYVKEQLGHHSIQMTVDVYGHLIPGSNREAVNSLDSQPSATYPQPAKTRAAQS